MKRVAFWSFLALAGFSLASEQSPGADLECPALSFKSAEPVPYCQLVNEPKKYDGRRVLTEAVWASGFHSGVLFDPACPKVDGRAANTFPGLVKGSNSESELGKSLWRILKERSPARVDLIGVFRGEQPTVTLDGQRFKLEVECLLLVRQSS